MTVRTQKQAGFTLIELLLVCGLIGIISAMALPRLLMAKQAADASSAIASLRTINSSELGFSASCGGGFYSPDLTTLAMAPVVLVNNKKMHDYMSNEKIDALLKELK